MAKYDRIKNILFAKLNVIYRMQCKYCQIKPKRKSTITTEIENKDIKK